MLPVVKSVNGSRPTATSLLGFDLLFGALPLLLLAPLLSLDFQNLWRQTEMKFFPIPILIVACFSIWNFGSPRSDQPLRLLLSRGLFLVGVGVFAVAVWRFSPLLAHFSLVLLFVGWAGERLGWVAWPRILGWTALLTTSMRLPSDLPARLQDWLVQQSSAAVGCILDGLSVPHLIRADTFSMRGLEFSLSECCSSVYSVYALASSVVLILLLTHRSFLVAILSLLTVPLWAIIQQVLLLLGIVLLKQASERDASLGLDRALVELGAFMIVLACCWAMTWFLAKISLPVPAADSEFEPEFLLLNSIACWPQPDPFAEGGPPPQPSEALQQHSMAISHLMQRVSWVGAVALVGLGIFSTHQVVYGNLAQPSHLPPIRMQQFASTNWKELFPEAFDRWRKVDETHQIQVIEGRDRAMIQWQFGWQGQIVQLSVTLPFNSHPRLASKYEAQGWRVLKEQAKQYRPSGTKANESSPKDESLTSSDASEIWTELSITSELGGQAYAIVAYHPLQTISSTTSPESDSSQPSMEYQVVLFCESGEALTVAQLSELYSGFQKANQHLRTEVEPRLLELLGGVQ